MDAFLVALVALFFLIEALVEVVDKFINEFHWKLVIAFALGVGASFFWGLDLFAYLEVPAVIEIRWLVLVVNAVFLGVISARWSGEINAILEILKKFKLEAQKAMGKI